MDHRLRILFSTHWCSQAVLNGLLLLLTLSPALGEAGAGLTSNDEAPSSHVGNEDCQTPSTRPNNGGSSASFYPCRYLASDVTVDYVSFQCRLKVNILQSEVNHQNATLGFDWDLTLLTPEQRLWINAGATGRIVDGLFEYKLFLLNSSEPHLNTELELNQFVSLSDYLMKGSGNMVFKERENSVQLEVARCGVALSFRASDLDPKNNGSVNSGVNIVYDDRINHPEYIRRKINEYSSAWRNPEDWKKESDTKNIFDDNDDDDSDDGDVDDNDLKFSSRKTLPVKSVTKFQINYNSCNPDWCTTLSNITKGCHGAAMYHSAIAKCYYVLQGPQFVDCFYHSGRTSKDLALLVNDCVEAFCDAKPKGCYSVLTDIRVAGCERFTHSHFSEDHCRELWLMGY